MGKVREASWRSGDIAFCDLIRRLWRLKVQASRAKLKRVLFIL